MDITKLVQGDSLNIDFVKNSNSKKLVILSAGAMKLMQDNKEKFTCLVEIDSKQINWTPNKTSMRNISEKYGMDSNGWIGKQISLTIESVKGREAIIGKPI